MRTRKRKEEPLKISEKQKLEPESIDYYPESAATLPYKSSRNLNM